MKVAAVQHDVVWEDAVATRAHVAPLVAAAAAGGARLVVLTEMFATGFTMAPDRVGEPPEGPSHSFLMDMASQHGAWVCASIPTIDPSRLRAVNRLVLAAPDGRSFTYDKMHPFSYGGEAEHYVGGTEFLTVDIEGLRTSFFVCYDLRFGDDWWQRAPLTDCYVVPANWPAVRRHHWQSLLVARAIENQAYVVGVNRVGDGGRLAYIGDSRIIDPLGEILASGAGTEALLVAEVDPEVVAATREKFRFGQDRRTFTY
jgi:predicted amidohydrolase